ncbi:Glycogen phosphorylase, partial [Haemophilus influenzae]
FRKRSRSWLGQWWFRSFSRLFYGFYCDPWFTGYGLRYSL